MSNLTIEYSLQSIPPKREFSRNEISRGRQEAAAATITMETIRSKVRGYLPPGAYSLIHHEVRGFRTGESGVVTSKPKCASSTIMGVGRVSAPQYELKT